MTAFAQLSTLPLVHVLGWTLLHFCWQGTLVALLLACVLGFLPSRASHPRYVAACVAMALMVVLPLITFAVLAAQVQARPELFTAAPPAQNLEPALSNPLATSAEPWTVRCERALNQSLPAVIGFWLAGVLVLLCRLNLGLMATKKIKLLAVEPAVAELETMVQALRGRLGVAQTIRLLHSARVQAPTVIGWLRPVILIPLGCVTRLSSAQIEAILAHELAHVRRHDYLVNLVQSVVETVLFYHPAVWWVSSRIRREREHCCDDLAVAVCGDRLAYAKALSFLEERRRPAPAGAFAATGGVLKMRIARVLGVKQATVFPRAAAVILLVMVGAAATLAALGAARAQSATEQKAESTGQITGKHAAMYRQWLDQDARWIITPEEKQAFLRLKNDQERDEFIRQFWETRNPNAGSPSNKYKQEHYRRIAYANMHFAQTGEPGWETDRGHVYIVFGPPDSIDAHPSGANGSTKPFEVWHYRSIQIAGPSVKNQNGSGIKARAAVARKDVDFRFVDDCGCGEYQLRSPWPSAMAPAGETDLPSTAALAGLGVQVISNSEGVNFRDWLTRWRQATDSTLRDLMQIERGAPEPGEVMIRFRVLPSGRVMDGSVVLEKKSGDAAFDRAAWDAITGSTYPPLPIGFGPNLELRAVFAGSIPAVHSSDSPGDAPQRDTQRSAEMRLQVRKLAIISNDLPQHERQEIIYAYQGRTYPPVELAERIRQNLRDRGYAKAHVEIQALPGLLAAPPAHPVDISVRISAGSQYKLAGIVVDGARAFPQSEILQQFPIHPGDLFSATAIGKGLDRLKKLYASKGYARLGVIPRLRMDDARHTVTLMLTIMEGKPNSV